MFNKSRIKWMKDTHTLSGCFPEALAWLFPPYPLLAVGCCCSHRIDTTESPGIHLPQESQQSLSWSARSQRSIFWAPNSVTVNITEQRSIQQLPLVQGEGQLFLPPPFGLGLDQSRASHSTKKLGKSTTIQRIIYKLIIGVEPWYLPALLHGGNAQSADILLVHQPLTEKPDVHKRTESLWEIYKGILNLCIPVLQSYLLNQPEKYNISPNSSLGEGGEWKELNFSVFLTSSDQWPSLTMCGTGWTDGRCPMAEAYPPSHCTPSSISRSSGLGQQLSLLRVYDRGRL